MDAALTDNKQKEGLHLSSTKITHVNISLSFLTIPIFMGHRLVRVSCSTGEKKMYCMLKNSRQSKRVQN